VLCVCMYVCVLCICVCPSMQVLVWADEHGQMMDLFVEGIPDVPAFEEGEGGGGRGREEARTEERRRRR